MRCQGPVSIQGTACGVNDASSVPGPLLFASVTYERLLYIIHHGQEDPEAKIPELFGSCLEALAICKGKGLWACGSKGAADKTRFLQGTLR